MRDVLLALEVFHGEVFDVLHLPLELDLGEGERLPVELDLERLDVVAVDVSVAQSVNELASLET